MKLVIDNEHTPITAQQIGTTQNCLEEKMDACESKMEG